MKKYCLSLLLFFAAHNAIAQKEFEGAWSGILKIQAMELGLVFNITASNGKLEATMDSPNQGAKGIPVNAVSTNKDSIYLEIPEIQMVYKGALLDRDNIKGSFTQRGQSFDLDLSKTLSLKNARPQEPQPPFPYPEEKISFPNKEAGIQLGGTLTLPQGKGPFPAIVLVSGSGPQDRDETILGHKPFLVLADYFTRNGYVVLRYDDRGVAQSGGEFQGATSADFANDAWAAVQFLQGRKEINKKRIGIMGHSEGGMVAGKLAAGHKELAYIVMLAGPGLRGDQILLQQQELIARAGGIPDSTVRKSVASNKNIYDIINAGDKDPKITEQKLRRYLSNEYKEGRLPHEAGAGKDSVINTYLQAVSDPWMTYFIQYDPQPDLAKIKIPVLALIGAKDHQVLPEYNIPALKSAFVKGKNKKATVLELEGLNHLFQEAETGMPQEYSSIEQTFSPAAMNTILDWLNKQTK
ncbi:MAG: alpha/beta fold hydrolase [Sphingobacteriales bacterium]|nr:MAG: alpha/beta fold hydrolase [Sphingobacteriales bacterium]